ncbi:TetR/AcrR family transcriptional regulator [Chitinophaga vietnamensis]|uniref:TetR/AcrR family transcriptional regulator n=1 Tax=Chitinophaga vietnamensis TaxID=2593957 RepID=UPI001178426D|nr:TetR/AcrR family transcriptional regulator [Chitinophaga vietnamensis]
MSGRPKIFDNEEVISKATEIFWEKGYEATSTEDLLSAMGIGKGSFYLAFKGGKRELYEKVVQQFGERAHTRLKMEIRNSKEPLEVVRNFFYEIAQGSKKAHGNGCFMGNTITELSAVDHALAHLATAELQALEGIFEDAIRHAQQKGKMKNKEEAALIARFLVTAWNGLNITRRMYPDKKTLQPLIKKYLEVLR